MLISLHSSLRTICLTANAFRLQFQYVIDYFKRMKRSFSLHEPAGTLGTSAWKLMMFLSPTAKRVNLIYFINFKHYFFAFLIICTAPVS